jgi:hypothetical protein
MPPIANRGGGAEPVPPLRWRRADAAGDENVTGRHGRQPREGGAPARIQEIANRIGGGAEAGAAVRNRKGSGDMRCKPDLAPKWRVADPAREESIAGRYICEARKRGRGRGVEEIANGIGGLAGAAFGCGDGRSQAPRPGAGAPRDAGPSERRDPVEIVIPPLHVDPDPGAYRAAHSGRVGVVEDRPREGGERRIGRRRRPGPIDDLIGRGARQGDERRDHVVERDELGCDEVVEDASQLRPPHILRLVRAKLRLF